jgi:hypothetical protein
VYGIRQKFATGALPEALYGLPTQQIFAVAGGAWDCGVSNCHGNGEPADERTHFVSTNGLDESGRFQSRGN